VPSWPSGALLPIASLFPTGGGTDATSQIGSCKEFAAFDTGSLGRCVGFKMAKSAEGLQVAVAIIPDASSFFAVSKVMDREPSPCSAAFDAGIMISLEDMFTDGSEANASPGGGVTQRLGCTGEMGMSEFVFCCIAEALAGVSESDLASVLWRNVLPPERLTVFARLAGSASLGASTDKLSAGFAGRERFASVHSSAGHAPPGAS